MLFEDIHVKYFAAAATEPNASVLKRRQSELPLCPLPGFEWQPYAAFVTIKMEKEANW